MRAPIIATVLVSGIGLSLYAQDINITGNLCAGSIDCVGTPNHDIAARDILSLRTESRTPARTAGFGV